MTLRRSNKNVPSPLLAETTVSMLDAAFEYANRNWSVFPLLRRSKKPFKGSHGWKDATVNTTQISQWWKETPEANIAVATGVVSGLFVVDVDPYHGGNETLACHEQEHGPLPPTVISHTSNGGRHILFRHPGSHLKVICRSPGLDKGIDIKGDGGYIVVPPNVHPLGSVYEWENPPGVIEMAEAPRWIIERATESTESTEAISVVSALSVADAIRRTLPQGEGQRNRYIFSFARAMKSIPEFADRKGAELESVVKKWHELALPVIGTKPFEDTFADFLHGWDRVKYPMGTGHMDKILERAKAAKVPEFARKYDALETHLLVKLCCELQREAGDGPFYLSGPTAGHMIGTGRWTAWRRLKVLKAVGVLEMVEKGTTQRATRWRYLPPLDE